MDNAGVWHFEIMTDAMALGHGSASVLGRSVIVHANADDYMTQPSGASGDRIACGVINLANGTDTVKDPGERYHARSAYGSDRRPTLKPASSQ